MALKLNVQQESVQEKPITAEMSKPTPAQEMQEIQRLIDRNRQGMMKSIKQMIDEQTFATLQYERNEFKKNLELAQLNITEMDKYQKLLMETTQKEITVAIAKITEKVDRLVESNKAVTQTINLEGKKLTEQTADTAQKLGDIAKKTIQQSLQTMDNEFQTLLDRHKAIADKVESMYCIEGYQMMGLWFYRWLMGITALYMLQRIFGVDSFLSWLKVLSGAALFNRM